MFKVAHITTIDMSLGYLLLNQLRSLQQDGYETIGISSPGQNVPMIEKAGIRHIPVPMTRNPFTPVQDLKALSQLYLIFRSQRFTIVHTHNPKPGFIAQIAAKMANVPIIINTLHGFYFHDHMRSALCRFYMTLEKIAARCSDVILSQNQEDIETAICRRICASEKIKYLGNGIDLLRFNPSRFTLKDNFRKRFEIGVPNGTRIVGFVGRLVRDKGLLELFAAARIVREQVPNVRFLIIGPTDFEKSDVLTPSIAREYDVADICHFLDMRQDMPELYDIMDVFVLPSYREGFPRSPMEASAMKVPCIVTDIRGCRETVEHGRNGLLVPLGDVRALSDAIVKLLTNRDKGSKMGEEGRRIALKRFDEERVFERVKAEYARLLIEKGLFQSNTSLLSTELTK